MRNSEFTNTWDLKQHLEEKTGREWFCGNTDGFRKMKYGSIVQINSGEKFYKGHFVSNDGWIAFDVWILLKEDGGQGERPYQGEYYYGDLDFSWMVHLYTILKCVDKERENPNLIKVTS